MPYVALRRVLRVQARRAQIGKSGQTRRSVLARHEITDAKRLGSADMALTLWPKVSSVCKPRCFALSTKDVQEWTEWD